jgi:flagellar biosynthesis protein
MPEKNKAYAVGYSSDEPAPRVLAGGEGWKAEMILRIARENGIPIHEDSDIIKVLEVLGDGAFIPEELYRAFAALLASLYAASKTMMGCSNGK